MSRHMAFMIQPFAYRMGTPVGVWSYVLLAVLLAVALVGFPYLPYLLARSNRGERGVNVPRIVLYISSALTLWPFGWVCRWLQRKFHLPVTFTLEHGLPITRDEDEPDDWVCWGAVGPKSVIKAAAAELDAKLDALLSTRSGIPVEPRVQIGRAHV